jgi:hypothetical protein
MSTKTVRYSDITFVPNLAEKGRNALYLGTVFEFSTRDLWVVALATRADLPKSALTSLDDLSRSLVENIFDVMKADITRALPEATEEGDVLAMLAAQNLWSISVSMPTEITVSLESSNAEAPDDIAQRLMICISRKSVPKVLDAYTGRQEYDAPKPLNLTPPWMHPPKCFQREKEYH